MEGVVLGEPTVHTYLVLLEGRPPAGEKKEFVLRMDMEGKPVLLPSWFDCIMFEAFNEC